MLESLSLSVSTLALLVLVVLAFAGGWFLREYLTRSRDEHVDDFLAEERRVQDMIKRLREEVAAPGAAEAPAAWSPPRDLPGDHSLARARLAPVEPDFEDSMARVRAPLSVSAAPPGLHREHDDHRFDDEGEVEVDVTTPPLVPRPVLMRASLVLLVVGGVFGVVWLEGLRRSGSGREEEWPGRAERALSSLPGAPEAALASDITATSNPKPSEQALLSGPSAATLSTAPTSTASSSPASSSGASSSPASMPAAEAAATSPRPAKPPLLSEDGTAASSGADPAAEAAPAVTAAELCAPLVPVPNTNKWRCDKPSDSTPGNYYYYTRIRTSRGTVVRHRWFRDDVLQQNIELRVGSSGPEGYRTYSRVPIGPDERGNWRVELLDASNRVLHEARLVVR